MRLKTLIVLGITLSLLVVALLGGGLAWISHRQKLLMQEHYAVDDFANGVYQLELLTTDYLLNHEQRARDQWLAHQATLREFLDTKNQISKDQAYQQLKVDLQRLRGLFLLAVGAHGESLASDQVAGRERSLAGQLQSNIERIAATATRLSSTYIRQFTKASRQLERLIWASFLVAVLCLGALWLVLAVRIIQPIRQLGQRIQQFGNDPGFRLRSLRQDEIGDLSRSFDQLADRLQVSTVSVEELEAEVESRKESETALRRSEKNLVASQRLAHIGSWELDLESDELWWSDEVYRIFEVDQNQFGGSYEAFVAAIHPDDRARVDDAYRTSLEDHRPYQVEHRLLFPDGRIKHVIEFGESTYDEQGRPVRSIGSVQDITAQKNAEQQIEGTAKQLEKSLAELEQSRGRLAQLLDTLPYGVQENDIHGLITFSNPAHHHILGMQPGELIGHAIWDFSSDEQEKVRLPEYLAYLVEEQPAPTPYLTRCRNRDGRDVDVEVVWDYRRDADGTVTGFISVISDISGRRVAEEKLRLLAGVFENTAEGVVITDADAQIIEVNLAFTEITGYPRDEVIGRNPRLLASGHHDREFYQAMWLSLEQTDQWRGEIWNRRKDGEVYPEWQHISAIRDERGTLTHYVSVFSDISQIKEAQEELDHLAHHDPLTGLPNRLLLLHRLEQAIRNARRHASLLAVLFIDLDRFKHVNDSLGHAVGDQLLCSVATRIRESLRENDTVSRIGGDEFVLVLEDVEKPLDVMTYVSKLMQCLERPHRLDNHEVSITPSIGICMYPDDGEDPSVLLRNADAAMYRAKSEGRNTYSYYTEELTRNAYERVQIENQLAKAVREDEFQLYYQSQIDIQTGRLVGMEALIRWFSPEMGTVSPAQFIPVAEDSGIIHAIGEWVLHEACRQGREWLDQGVDFGRISINIAGPQIQRGGLPEIVGRILEQTGLPAECLELEITEGFIMRHAEMAVEQLQALRNLGVSLAIDDFGTGHSSLAYLKQLPVDKLKVDQSFVRDIPDDPNDMAIVDAVIAMGKSLGLTIIAEGVETSRQADFLRKAGCHQAQGYLYAKPVPAEEMIEHTDRNRYWI